jgi:hypothetical protein
MHPLDWKALAYLISRTAYRFTFIFPDPVKHLHQRYKTTVTNRIADSGIVKQGRDTFRSGFVAT